MYLVIKFKQPISSEFVFKTLSSIPKIFAIGEKDKEGRYPERFTEFAVAGYNVDGEIPYIKKTLDSHNLGYSLSKKNIESSECNKYLWK